MFRLRVTYLGFDAQVDERVIAIIGKPPYEMRYEYLAGRRTMFWDFESQTRAEIADARLLSVWNAVRRYHKQDAKRAWRTMHFELETEEDAPITAR